MDNVDRAIINEFQGGFPICAEPYKAAAAHIGVDEAEFISRLSRLVEQGLLSRFGPLYNAEKMGGAVTLAGMAVPEADFERIATLVNAHPEVAHNYERRHTLNMWFVVATERPEQIAPVIAAIERESGLKVYDMPKLDEFFIGLRLTV